jgi:hypothetical protein
MALTSFFTTPDPDLFQESSLDPLGIMPIWMQYGQSLFNNRLTTIANDVRIFNFNLFHHYVLFDLLRQYPEVGHTAKERYREWRTDTDLKAGMIIFLEQLVSHIFFSEGENDSTIDTIGILGLNKARLAQSTLSADKITLRANKNSGLLRNQVALGMNGRYKGPMMNMGYFDRSYSYLPNAWEGFGRVISKWPETIDLAKSLHQLFLKELFQSPGRTSPQLSLDTVRKSKHYRKIRDGYIACFGKTKLTAILRNYWKDQLGLNSGAPAVLYDLLSRQSDKQSIRHEQVFQEASSRLKKEPSERQKVDRILEVEPFLSAIEYLFRYLAQPGIRKLAEVSQELNQLKTVVLSTATIDPDPAIPRLNKLMEAAKWTGNLHSWIANIQAYHQGISLARGGSPWFELDSDGNIRHHYAPSLNENYNTPQKYYARPFWWHTYYLETLRSVQIGLS